MKVYMLADVEGIGMKGEIIKVTEGYGRNFLIPRKMAVEVTDQNEPFFRERARTIEHRKEVIASKTSMLAERIKSLKLILKKKMHDDGKLYGSVSPVDVVHLLAVEGVSVAKSQVKFDKSIKAKGEYEVTIKLTSSLQPKVRVQIVPE